MPNFSKGFGYGLKEPKETAPKEAVSLCIWR
jgi:hypothetical protein